MSKITISDKVTGAFRDNWNFCVGTERMGIALQKEYQDTLEYVQKAINFKYIRGHGLFHDDTAIYRENEIDGEMKPFYNFTYIDKIFDSFLEKGLKPFVELGFMPSQLASGEQKVFYWKGNVTPPKDYSKWKDLIQALIKHFISRYGIEEVLQWPFEVWNEPNLKVFWKDADETEYFKLYKVSAMAIKEINKDLQVGGPAICGGADYWIKDFLEFCKKENAPVDFVSRHLYSAHLPKVQTHEFCYQDLKEPEEMLKELQTVRQMIDNSPFPYLSFHITEYNTSYNPLNPVHDTCLNAAYLARIISEAGDIVDSFSYWTFSDIFEEADVPRAQFHGGFGLVALNNIPKPTFHMFSFFEQMGKDILYRDENMLATRKTDGTVTITVWNPVMEKGEHFDKDFSLELNLPKGEYFINRTIVNEKYGNPWKTWIQMGRPRFTSKKQVEILRNAARPMVISDRVSCAENMLLLEFSLSKNEVSFFEIIPVADETDTYYKLDDSMIPGY
ncbi:glycosyl hydrolase [Clostridium sp. BNL1100]|uniref:GH39 family glycosyl hydrolase n=1 Tax=Clostridium sp. BNL1100 TaxID=755731 RepID=UPI00024A77BE|nr:glycosyl hydrolase [Clostridium sp. BNL1100]AEY65198.1 beta-xylosidase [Clostridium sp. BNL1100]